MRDTDGRIELATVHFDIVGGCQLRCVGCPNSTILSKVTRIEPSFFGSCLRNIDVDNVRIFRLFNYGESLLHDDLPAIFDEMETSPTFSVDFLELSTNAQFARWDQLADVFARRMLNRLVVSCDGDGTRSSYERLRPPAKWDTLIAFLAKARELRDRHCPDMELMTRTVIFDQSHVTAWEAVLGPLGWKPEFRRWINLVGAAEDLSGRAWEPGHGICAFVGPALNLYVDSTGTVVPCCAHPGAADLGNLSTERWSAIHFGDKRRDFVVKLASDRASLAICRSCEFGSQTDFSQYEVPGQRYT